MDISGKNYPSKKTDNMRLACWVLHSPSKYDNSVSKLLLHTKNNLAVALTTNMFSTKVIKSNECKFNKYLAPWWNLWHFAECGRRNSDYFVNLARINAEPAKKNLFFRWAGNWPFDNVIIKTSRSVYICNLMESCRFSNKTTFIFISNTVQ